MANIKQRAMESARARNQRNIRKTQRQVEELKERAFAVPEIKNAYSKYITLRLSPESRATEAEINDAYKIYIDTLKKFGFDIAEFDEAFLCKKCKDTGSIDGKICSCIRGLYLEELEKECDILKKAPFTFKDCDLSIFKDETQRKLVTEFYKFMKVYAEHIPDSKLKFIVLSGGVGTGKTCIASAVARETVKRGKSCKFVSAYQFNEEMLACHTSPVSERRGMLEDTLTCDLLVIDDLGTEPLLKKVTVEYLLLVLEERLRAGLCTIITTNLSSDRILDKYGDRIMSRLSDKRHSKFILVEGKDLRTQK